MFLGKGVLKTCSKFTGEHPCWNAISIKLKSNFVEIALQHGCSPVYLLHIFRTAFIKNIFGRLLLKNTYEKITDAYTAWKLSKYGVFSGQTFPVFGLNTFHAVIPSKVLSEFWSPSSSSHLKFEKLSPLLRFFIPFNRCIRITIIK